MTARFRVGGVPEHFNAPWHIAQANGSLSAEKLAVDWTEFSGGTGAMCKAVNSDELDLAIVLTEGACADIMKGGKHKIVGVYVQSPLCWGVHVSSAPHASKLKKRGDLKESTFAVSRLGSGSHLMSYVLAQESGWDPKKVEFETVGNMDGAREALSENKAHIFMWEKFTTKFLVDSGEWRRVDEFFTPWPCFVIVASNKVLATRENDVQRLLKVINGECTKFKANKGGSTIKYLQENHGLSKIDAKTWLSGQNAVQWCCKPTIAESVLQTVTATLCSVGVVTKKQCVDPSELVSAFTDTGRTNSSGTKSVSDDSGVDSGVRRSSRAAAAAANAALSKKGTKRGAAAAELSEGQSATKAKAGGRKKR
jgi:hypothetical protein